MSNTKAVHAMISGRVQGVWYRAWTVEQATSRGLTGWVRNRSDGAVEAVFAGPSDKVDDMVKACREGPPRARVAGVAITPASDPGLKEFEQRATH
jgi:acylphosphatase